MEGKVGGKRRGEEGGKINTANGAAMTRMRTGPVRNNRVRVARATAVRMGWLWWLRRNFMSSF